MGLEKAYGLVARCIPDILLAPLEVDFSVAYGNGGGRGHTQELVDLQVVPSSGRS